MKSPLDVLLLCFDDNSNSMFRYWKCLKHLGLNAIAFKGRLHPFGYPVQVPLHPVLGNVPIKVYGPTTIMGPGLETLIQSAHVVHLFHSTYVLTPVDLKAKHVVVQHGGMAYRQYADQCNAVFNEIADATIVQCPDLLGLGAKNEHLIYYPVDTDFIQFNPKRRDRERIIFGHFPSNPGWKGTKEIMEVLKEFLEDPDYKDRIGVRCSMNPTPWLENLAMIKSCDVVIEAMRPEQKGHRYGEWGNTALESAASGALVITHHLSEDVYKREYGTRAAIFVANSKDELRNQIAGIFEMKGHELGAFRNLGRSWAESNHSIQATAARLWDKVYKNFFDGGKVP